MVLHNYNKQCVLCLTCNNGNGYCRILALGLSAVYAAV